MGTMERMRQTSPYFLAAFAIIFVGFMVASDADISNLLRKGENPQTSSIAKVNGEKILYRDFEAKVHDQIEQQRKQLQQQGQEGQDIDDLQIRRSVWSEMIEQILLEQQYKDMGVFVSKDEILDILFNDPPEFLRKPFTDSAGVFQKESYTQIMRNPEIIATLGSMANKSPEDKKIAVNQFRSDLIRIEKAMVDERMRTTLNNVVNSSLSLVSPSFAREKYLSDNSSADMNYIMISTGELSDNQVKVSDDEIKAYYDKYKSLWPQKAKRKIKYVNFALVPSTVDTANAVKAVKDIENELAKAQTPEEKSKAFDKKAAKYKGEVKDFTQAKDVPPQVLTYLTGLKENDILGPLSQPEGVYFYKLDGKRSGENFVVQASHILIEFGNNKDSSKAEATRIMKEAKTGDFAELAEKYSSDKGSAAKGGDVGFFSKGQMVKPFEEAAFAASKGQIVGPVESQFGWHIIKVVDKQSDEFKYTSIKIKPEISRMTTKALGRDAKEFKAKVDAGENFDAVAKTFNKIPRQTDFFDREKPALGSNFISAKAFELNVGKVIDPVELKNYGVVVVLVLDQRQAGLIPFEDMKEKIKTTLIAGKKLDAIKSKADAIYNKVRSYGSLAYAMTIDPNLGVKTATGVKNNGIIPGVGQDFAFTAKAFELPLNKISEPVRGEKGYYIIEITVKQIPGETQYEAQMKEYMNQLRNNFKSGGYYQWFNQIKEDAKIEDNRVKYFGEF